jgi:hypothetical protein
MKAAYTRYGPPDVVEVSDLDKPIPRHNEVLIESARLPSIHSTRKQ